MAGSYASTQTSLTAAQELLDDRAALTRALFGGVDEPDAEPPFSEPSFGIPTGAPGPIASMVRRSGSRNFLIRHRGGSAWRTREPIRTRGVATG